MAAQDREQILGMLAQKKQVIQQMLQSAPQAGSLGGGIPHDPNQASSASMLLAGQLGLDEKQVRGIVGDLTEEQVPEVLKELQSGSRMAQAEGNLSAQQKDAINRAAGQFTSLADTSTFRDIPGARERNVEREEKRLALDKKLRSSDPIVNTALLNNAREDARAAGIEFDAASAKKIIKQKQEAGETDFSQVHELVAEEVIDKQILKLAKRNKLDAMITKGFENKALRVKALTGAKKDMRELIGSNVVKLTTPVKTALQKTLVENHEAAAIGEQLTSLFNPDYFNSIFQGQQAFAASKEEVGFKLNSVQQRNLGDYTQFKTQLKKFFNKYKVAISGGAVSAEEMVDLEKAVVNGTMSPTEAASTLRGMRAELDLDRNAKMKLLQEDGFRVTEANKDTPNVIAKIREKQQAMVQENPKFRALLGEGTGSPAAQGLDGGLREQLLRRKAELEGRR